jgi:hypothetical protein
MAYKKEKPIIQGTDGHKSALKFSLGAAFKGGGKLASRAVPGLGWALAAYDVGKLGYYSVKKGSFKEGAKELGRDYGLVSDEKKKKNTKSRTGNKLTSGSKNLTKKAKSTSVAVGNMSTKSKPNIKSKLPTYEQSYTSEVADKWKDKGGKKAYIQAAKDWNAKNRK